MSVTEECLKRVAFFKWPFEMFSDSGFSDSPIVQSFIAVRHVYVCFAVVEITILGQDEAPKYVLASDVRISN